MDIEKNGHPSHNSSSSANSTSKTSSTGFSGGKTVLSEAPVQELSSSKTSNGSFLQEQLDAYGGCQRERDGMDGS